MLEICWRYAGDMLGICWEYAGNMQEMTSPTPPSGDFFSTLEGVREKMHRHHAGETDRLARCFSLFNRRSSCSRSSRNNGTGRNNGRRMGLIGWLKHGNRTKTIDIPIVLGRLSCSSIFYSLHSTCILTQCCGCSIPP